MKNLTLLFLLAMMFTCACSDNTESISLCDCKPDEYCVDDECYPTDANISPSPTEDK